MPEPRRPDTAEMRAGRPPVGSRGSSGDRSDLHFRRAPEAGGFGTSARIDDPMRTVERWRYRCPRGHTGWEFTGRQFWCAQCHAGAGSGSFDRLHDRKTDDRVGPIEWRNRA